MTFSNDKLINKAFRSYLLVNMLIVLAGTLGVLVDGIVIGQVLDQSSVSAYGLSGSAVVLMSAVSGVFSTGSGAKIANYIGKGDTSNIQLNFTVTILTCTLVSACFTLVCFFGCEQIVMLLGAKDELVPLAADYIKGLSIGIIPNMLSPALMQYNRLEKHAKLSFLGVIAMTVVNIILEADTITFRIRDDGAAFNPIRYADNAKDLDAVGIQIVRKLARYMDYSHAVNMNNLLVVL